MRSAVTLQLMAKTWLAGGGQPLNGLNFISEATLNVLEPGGEHNRRAIGCAGNQARGHMGQDAASSQGLALTQINPVGSVGWDPLKQEIWKRLP
jgi:hypothetical protein